MLLGVHRIRIPGWKGPQGSAGPAFLSKTWCRQHPVQPDLKSAQCWGIHHFPEDILQWLLLSRIGSFPGVTFCPLPIIFPCDSLLKGHLPWLPPFKYWDMMLKVSPKPPLLVAEQTPFTLPFLCVRPSQALDQPVWPCSAPSPACPCPFCIAGTKTEPSLWVWPNKHWEYCILDRFCNYFLLFLKLRHVVTVVQ